jgi:hypothetical protein
VTAEAQSPGNTARDARIAAAFDGVKPYVATTGAIALMGAPAEVVVPLGRRLRGRSGVSVGPGLVNLANGLIGLGLVHFFRRHPAGWKRSTAQGLPGGLGVAVLVSLLLGPAAAVRWGSGPWSCGTGPRCGVVSSRRSACCRSG